MSIPTSAPKPAPPKVASTKTPSPKVLAGKTHHPVKVPVVSDLDAAELAAAASHGVVDGESVVLIDGDVRHVVGPAEGDEPLLTYARRYFEHIGALERFHGRLETSELSIRDIDGTLTSLRAVVTTPDCVGDLAAFRERLAPIEAQATVLRDAMAAAKAEARAVALGEREEIVARAEAIAAKGEDAIRWKDDTAELRQLLDTWKTAQKGGARLGKDSEKELWQRFAHARSTFERTRKHHFAELDKVNTDVASHKEALTAKAESLATSRDWDATSRAFRDLMGEWKNAGRGRRSADDALWTRFRAAQDAFFEAKRIATEASVGIITANLEAKEAAVKDAEAILPVRDLPLAKSTLRGAQDRFEAAGEVAKPDAIRLARRLSAVEKAVRDADGAVWERKNPELEARASGAAQQLVAAIADLDRQIAAATKSGDAKAVASLKESRDARQSWLDQIQASVS
jgi:hypothetical protein